MKALLFYDTRDIRIENIDIPTPTADEVLLEVTAAGLSQTQINEFIEGPYIINKEPHPMTGISAPLVPCQEYGGIIKAVGANVDPALVGKQVSVLPLSACGTCINCQRHNPNTCEKLVYKGLCGDHGGFAEYSRVHKDNIFPCERQDLLTFIEPILVAIHSANVSRLTPKGKKVLVIGAGAVGCAAAAVWKYHFGAEVVLYDRLEERVNRAKGLNILTTHQLSAEKYDVIIDAAGKDLEDKETAFMKAMKIIHAGGTVINLGAYFFPVEFLPVEWVTKEIAFLGSFAYNFNDVDMLNDVIKSLQHVDFSCVIEEQPLENLVQEGYYRAEINKESFTRIVMIHQ